MPKLESWREALKFISRCPICNTVYSTEEAKLCAQSAKAALVHLTCAKCQGYFVTMVLNLGQGMSSVGMMTDLNFVDAKRVLSLPALELDEVLTGYEIIQNNLFVNSLIVK